MFGEKSEGKVPLKRELGRLQLEAAFSQGSTGFISGPMEERNLARKLLGLNMVT